MSSYSSSRTITESISSDILSIDALLAGMKWGGAAGSGVDLSFSFPWTTNDTAYWQNGYPDEPDAYYHYGLDNEQSDAARSALQAWADVADLHFSEIDESGSEVGDIRFAFSSSVADDGAWGWCYYPDSYWANSGDVWISTAFSPEDTNMDFSRGGYGFHSLIHELGHGLGLKHPGNYNGSDVGGEEGPFLSAEDDTTLYSIMSYNEPENNWWRDTQTSSWVTPNDETPMVLDIAAIQYLYGSNESYNAADDLYAFGESAPFRMTLWDGGGYDTISAEYSTRSSFIDLTPGSYSSIQTTRAYAQHGISDTYDGSYNLGIAYGVIIEEAIGGFKSDILIGNSADNEMWGSSGNDWIDGSEGDDTLDGGQGSDTLYGGSGNDVYWVENSKDAVIEYDNEGIDAVITVVTYRLGTNIEDLSLRGSSALKGYGNTSDNAILGNSGKNTLDGKSGNDVISGGSGNDKLIGGEGDDVFVFDSILGSKNIDTIVDFTKGEDHCQLSSTFFSEYNGEMVSVNKLASASEGAHLIYETSSRSLYYDADGSGIGNKGILFVKFTGQITLDSTDFILV